MLKEIVENRINESDVSAKAKKSLEGILKSLNSEKRKHKNVVNFLDDADPYFQEMLFDVINNGNEQREIENIIYSGGGDDDESGDEWQWALDNLREVREYVAFSDDFDRVSRVIEDALRNI